MSAAPQWSPIDSDTASLLDLLADDGSLSTDREWTEYVEALKFCAFWSHDDVIRPNDLRAQLRGKVKPQRVGAFANRALKQGLVEYTGEWETSTDREGRNHGKPCRTMRWLGGGEGK